MQNFSGQSPLFMYPYFYRIGPPWEFPDPLGKLHGFGFLNPPSSLQNYATAVDNTTEFDSIAYECKVGSKPLGTADGKFHVQCENGAQWPSSPAWPQCEVPYFIIELMIQRYNDILI